jgi:hypothetical protein
VEWTAADRHGNRELAGASRAEMEELADRFCAEHAVSVVADRALEERR